MPLEPGQTLAHYRILRQIGQGGMGAVFLAEDTRLDRQVALKVLPPAMALDADRLERFQREARAVAALNHPHIVTIHSVEEEGDTHFLTMELVDGESLDRVLSAGGLPLAKVFDIGIALASALSAAHEKGIIHRDLKPANVMITRDGWVKVLDFGLAKLAAEAASPGGAEDGAWSEVTSARTRAREGSLTAAGMMVGTIPYMSPEQVGGETVDARTDIFSLGVVLYELTTGRRPFAGKNPAETISAILRDAPRPLTEAREEAPRHLGRIVDHCLRKDPLDRYQTARDVFNELRELRREVDSGTSSAATSRQAIPGPLPPSAVAPRRMGTTLLVSTAIVLGLTGLAFGIWSLRGRGEPGPSAARPFESLRMKSLLADPNLAGATLSGDGRYLAYIKGPEGRWSLRVRQIATGSDVEILPPQPAPIRGVCFSPDGDYLYYLARDTENQRYSALFEVPSLGGAPRKRIFDVDTALTFSPDGRRAAFVRGVFPENKVELIVIDVGSNRETVLASIEPFGKILHVRPAWSPDGVRIVVLWRDTEADDEFALMGFDATTGEREPVSEPRAAAIPDFAWLPDGSGLIASTARSIGMPVQIYSFPYPSGEPRQITNDLDGYREVSVSADGRSIATIRSSQEERLWMATLDDPGSTRPLTPRSGSGWVRALVTLGDGSVLFTAPQDSHGAIWRLDAGGSGAVPITSEAGWPAVLIPSPDGRSLFFDYYSASDNVSRIWTVDVQGTNPRPLTDGPRDRLDAISPDGRMVYFRDDRIRGRTWRVPREGGEREEFLDGHLHDASFSPDGRYLLYAVDEVVEGQSRDRFFVVPAAGGDPVAEFLPPGDTEDVQWSRDGDSLTYRHSVDGMPNLWRQPVRGGEPVQVTHFSEGRAGDHEPSPDGAWISIRRSFDGVDNLWIMRPDGTGARPVTDFREGVLFEHTWSRDSRSLLVVQGEIRREVVLLERDGG